ncbi:MAG TPA: aminotransferase class I/II-fold pyridoxal phosphate-dependent enzyme [Bacteroidota bacterium]|nr:aminotransferase class I/II-fold pyridoxal phosphate-dependent enzyme [Bacteroidota bacterium]
MKANTQPIIYLDRNESQFGPAPECFEILRNASRDELSSYSRDFMRGVKSILSEALAGEYGLAEKNVLLSYGSEDMLKQIVHCYLAPGEAMMIPEHSWWYYKSVAGEVNGRILEYPLHVQNKAFSYSLDEVIATVKARKPRLLLFASPNNPTGNTLPFDDLRKLLDECKETLVVVDEAYSGFTNVPTEIVPRLTLTYPHLCVLRTFSKLYALAGARIGYTLVGKNYEKLVTFSARYLGYNQLTERLALAALRNPSYYASIAKTTAAEREKFYQFFDGVEGCAAYRSDANFILVKFPPEAAEPLRKHLTEEGLVIKFFSAKEFPNHARITVGTPEQNALLIGQMRKHFAREKVLVSP